MMKYVQFTKYLQKLNFFYCRVIYYLCKTSANLTYIANLIYKLNSTLYSQSLGTYIIIIRNIYCSAK